ncbi:helix-turn-helix transcriptional regulator [Aneurinibacillus sp. Ricciae_BoGa-3]|uniref:helix-turn-helix domain-containing protein n=1 Tax=Aneurinibacillus sp. Ricciae_BoGa-3 TaxID=3022697 RepID=UPI00234007ED|nr:helix-turn-helix transcriptional regulator [Aneurinibacillus sp. Ricciae_BoGa-3]WCK54759.1 helix-turn-helix transcriptional regulator [Aneurinibacillus sp. Ricciae_BoGa-3]
MNKNLSRIRKLKGITQKQLADYLEVSTTAISLWETNPNEKIPKDRLEEIAEYLNVSAEDFFTEELDEERIKENAREEKIKALLQEQGKASASALLEQATPILNSALQVNKNTEVSPPDKEQKSKKIQNDNTSSKKKSQEFSALMYTNEQRTKILHSILETNDEVILKQLDSFLSYLQYVQDTKHS